MVTRTVAGINGELIAITEEGRRTFSKLKLYVAVKELGLWPAVKAWLEEQDLWDAFLLAQDVSEDDPMFSTGLSALKGRLGITDEKAEEILAGCVAEGA